MARHGGEAAPGPSSGPETVGRPARHRRIRTILLASDLTDASDKATQEAIDLAASLQARLLIVHVIDPSSHVSTRRTRVDQQRADREQPLLAVVGDARAAGVEATYLLWTGEPGHSIVAAAGAEHVDLIVVGTRGLDRAGRFLLGSVSDYVVYHAPCPVLVAR